MSIGTNSKKKDKKTKPALESRQRKREIIEMADELELFVRSIQIGGRYEAAKSQAMAAN